MLETYVQPVTPEVVTPIKPSEAIRLGCLLAPVQITGRLTAPDGRACALGAMLKGYGGFELPPEEMTLSRHASNFVVSVLGTEAVDCPVCGHLYPQHGGAPCTPTYAITHLNDDHLWRRERIADWLEGLGL